MTSKTQSSKFVDNTFARHFQQKVKALITTSTEYVLTMLCWLEKCHSICYSIKEFGVEVIQYGDV